MGSYDPRQIRVVLEDLRHYLGIWSGAATDALNEADYTQTITREQVNRAAHHASMVKSQAEKDAIQVDAQKPEHDALTEKSRDAAAAAQDTLSKTGEAYRQAQKTLTHWQSELEKALAWLERAKIRLEKAEREYEAARANIERARNRVERAERNYNRCRNSENGRDCRSEAREVERAIEDYNEAVVWLEIAQAELEAAIDEYNRAVARVNCCRQAVAYAGEAAEQAAQAQASAAEGERMSALSVEYAVEVNKLFGLAQKMSDEEMNTAVQMNIVVREATTHTDHAQRYLAQADSLEESAQGYYYRADTELDFRIDRLIELNQSIPITASAGTPASSNKTSSPVPRKSNRIDSKWVNMGIEIISVSALPVPEGVQDASDFHKIPMEEMEQGILRLQEMLPVIKSEQGRSSDYWADVDVEKGLDYANGYQRVYDAFYGNDAIKVTFDGNTYDITNGRHRIWLAKRMGIDSLPMNITRRTAD